MRLFLVTLFAVLAFASPAFASGVTITSASNAAPSNAAGARTVYAVSFSTSATGGLSQVAGSRIDVTFDTGTGLAAFTGATVRDVTSATNVGSCNVLAGLTMRCTLFAGATIAAGHSVTITFNAITNPSTPGTGYVLKVTTSADTDLVTSPAMTVAAANPLTNLTVGIDQPSAAAGARTQYVVDFKASATGGLSQAANSRIDVTFPAGTAFAGYTGATVRDVTTATNVGSCGGDVGLVISCTLFSSATINASDAVRITFNGITNPSSTGAKTASVATTSDTQAVTSAAFTVVAGNALGALTLNNATPSRAAGARTQYVAAFTVSTTGGLSQAANSRIQVTFPAGTTFAGYTGASVRDMTTATNVGSCGSDNALVIECTLFSAAVINAGDSVQITFNGITNPPSSGAKTISAMTTSDLPAVTSAAFQVVDANALTGLTLVNASPSAAAGARTLYVAEFTVSATGGLAQAANSRIDVTFPAGTTFAGYTGASVRDMTTATNVGSCGTSVNLAIDCTLFSAAVINPGDTVRITFNGITNPASAGANTIAVTTTSDQQSVTSSPFDVVAANALSALTLVNTSPSGGAGARTLYVAEFTVSATGGLAQAANSRIDVTFPAGTTFAGYVGASVRDVTTATNVGSCGTNVNLAIDCTLFSAAVINPGDTVRITFNGITNPATTGAKTIAVTTTSDTQAVTSAPFTVAAGNALSALAVTVSSTTPGAQAQYVVRFTASATGGLAQAANSRIDVTFPAGTTFAATAGSVHDVTLGRNVGSCGTPVGLAIDCTFFSGAVVNALDDIRITFTNITNPAAAGPQTLSATTTSDTPAVTSSAYQQGDTVPPDTTIDSGPTGGATSPTRSFTFSSATDSGATFQCRVDTAAFAACTSPYTTPAQANGTHTFEVRALDAAGNPDLTPASRSFTITASAPAAPVIVSPAQDAVVATSTVRLTGTSEAGTTVEVFEGATSEGVAPASDGTWTLTLTSVPDGEHTYTARASSPAGTSPASTARTIRVQNTAPPAPPSVSGGSTDTPQAAEFTFTTTEPGTTFECSLDDGPFTACTSPQTYSGLPAGEHTFRVRAVSAARGAGAPASRSFSVAAQPLPTAVPTAAPTPTATPAPTATPQPTFKKDVVAAPASGTILVCAKPGVNCHTLKAGEDVPVGQTIDARKGVVVLTAAGADGKQESAKFYAGMFKVSQTATSTDLTLNEPLAPCPKGKKASSSAKKPKSRKLWGDGKGKFRTKGQYSAATIRGTQWLVQDSCAGTLTQVKVGVVSVFDQVKKKTITLRAGKRYTAKPR